MHSLLCTCIYRCSVLCLLIVLAAWFAPAVRADGGAPQRAYVAGAGQGLSIIDIAQQRVTRSLALAGNPHAVLLSPDGSTLYATQSALGQVRRRRQDRQDALRGGSHRCWRFAWMLPSSTWRGREIPGCAR